MRRLIITGGGDQHAAMAEITVPTLRAYANRIGAHFIQLHDSELDRPDIHRWWIKTKMNHAFQLFGEVAWIDIDCIVRPDCPDIFDVAGGRLAWFPESEMFPDRCAWFREYCRIMGGAEPSESWDGKYYNGGVMVIPKYVSQVVAMPDPEALAKAEAMIKTHPRTFWSDQNWFNYQAASAGIQSVALPLAFNHMPFDQFWSERHGANIIHYAGLLNCMGDRLLELIREDLKAWGCFT